MYEVNNSTTAGEANQYDSQVLPHLMDEIAKFAGLSLYNILILSYIMIRTFLVPKRG
jgi:hypothetical protein